MNLEIQNGLKYWKDTTVSKMTTKNKTLSAAAAVVISVLICMLFMIRAILLADVGINATLCVQ